MAIAQARGGAYRAADPFPHAVFDDFLPEEVADAVLSEFPAPGDVAWWQFDDAHERKLASFDESVMGEHTRLLLAQCNSAAFLAFLEALTGIEGLVPDPLYYGGGLHQIERGGFLQVHADFNIHPTTHLYRRLNLLVYLNRDWQDEYGGHLELWDRAMKRAAVRIAPVFNRCVLFDTGRYSYHGHPEPLACPEGATRKSLALYYYTRDPAPGGPDGDHSTLFQQPRRRTLIRRSRP